jgi:hypothetical protein
LALTTIVAILAKLALLYSGAGEAWFEQQVDGKLLYIVLASVFMIFLRGKMMHDDSAYFKELEAGTAFKNDRYARVRIKFGLFVGYLSWLCWAPAVYFLERPRAFAAWMLVAIGLSTLWLLGDVFTRQLPNTDPEAKKRKWLLCVNVLYLVALLAMFGKAAPEAAVAVALVLVLVVDWLTSDSFGPFTPAPKA